MAQIAPFVAIISNCSLPIDSLYEAYSNGVCYRCLFRLGCVMNPEIYRQNNDVLDVVFKTVFSSKDKFQETSSCCLENPTQSQSQSQENGSFCPCCLGILSCLYLEAPQSLCFNWATLNHIENMLRTSDYCISNYTLSIQIPASTYIRQTAMQNSLSAKSEIVELKDALRWIILPILEKVFVNATYDPSSNTLFKIVFSHEQNSEEVELFLGKDSKGHRNNAPPGVAAVLHALQEIQDIASLRSPPISPKSPCTFEITIDRSPVYIMGRYMKFKRGLSQTPWVIEGNRIGESSVQEIIGDAIVPYFKAASCKFHSAGREDVDVRMLGNGRPFILELIDAKIENFPLEIYEEMSLKINQENEDVVQVTSLRSTDKQCFAALQAGAESKKKTYCCVVWVSKSMQQQDYDKIQAIHDLPIFQKTPVRVLHRRTLMTREKIVHCASYEKINQHYFLLRLTTSAGMYVKEFIHGDLGRTSPSLGSLLECEADILQLDVEELIDCEQS